MVVMFVSVFVFVCAVYVGRVCVRVVLYGEGDKKNQTNRSTTTK